MWYIIYVRVWGENDLSLKKRVIMDNVFRSVDSLETEGDAREAYAEWLTKMEGAIIESYEVVSLVTDDTLIDFD